MWVEHHTHPKGFTVQDPDRWVSRSPCGQDCWQILSQWIWNLRLELGQQLSPTAMRVMEFAPAQAVESVQATQAAQVVESVQATQPTQAVEFVQATQAAQVAEPAQAVESVQAAQDVSYGPPQWARRSFTKGFAGSDFLQQPDGTLRCPASHPLTVQERPSLPTHRDQVRHRRNLGPHRRSLRSPRRRLPPSVPLSPFSGGIGTAVLCGVAGSSCFVHKRLFFLLIRFNWRRKKTSSHQMSKPEHNVRIGA